MWLPLFIARSGGCPMAKQTTLTDTIKLWFVVKEYEVSDYLRMSGLYWSLTFLDLCRSIDKLDRTEIVEYVKRNHVMDTILIFFIRSVPFRSFKRMTSWTRSIKRNLSSLFVDCSRRTGHSLETRGVLFCLPFDGCYCWFIVLTLSLLNNRRSWYPVFVLCRRRPIVVS